MGNNHSGKNTNVYNDDKILDVDIEQRIKKLFVENRNNQVSEMSHSPNVDFDADTTFESRLSTSFLAPSIQDTQTIVGGTRQKIMSNRNRYDKYNSNKQQGGRAISDEYTEISRISELDNIRKVVLDEIKNDTQTGGGIDDIFINPDASSPATAYDKSENNFLNLLKHIKNTNLVGGSNMRGGEGDDDDDDEDDDIGDNDDDDDVVNTDTNKEMSPTSEEPKKPKKHEKVDDDDDDDDEVLLTTDEEIKPKKHENKEKSKKHEKEKSKKHKLNEGFSSTSSNNLSNSYKATSSNNSDISGGSPKKSGKNKSVDVMPFYSSESSTDYSFQHPYVRNRFS
jgi:hypothetical protein